MRVCINTWTLYNEGLHRGTWCEIEDYEDTLEELKEIQEENDLGSDIEPFLADWADDDLGLCKEHSDLEKLREMYEAYDNLSDYEKDCLAFLMYYQGHDFSEAMNRLEDVQCYEANSWEDLAIQFIEEGLYGEDVSKLWVTNSMYLDTEYMGRELQYDYTEYDGKYYRCN